MEKLYELFKEVGGIVSTDSRKAKGLFFALKGEKFDGNQFAKSALQSGATYAIVDDPLVQDGPQYILVDDVLSTLQSLALMHRKSLSDRIKIIAITGTNGKTTTKELIRDVLSVKYNVVSTLGNFNNHIGVPLTLLSMTENTDIGVVEMGANHPGEIKELCNIAEPDYGIITNVGVAHLEGFVSEEGIRKTKGELYDFLSVHNGTAFCNSADSTLLEMAKNRQNLKTVLYNQEVVPVETEDGLLSVLYNGKQYKTNFVGDVNSWNISAALAIGKYMNVDANEAMSAITSYIPSNNRSQYIETKLNNRVILDAYNANPSSLALAMENFSKLKSGNKCMIIGQMNELGPRSKELHRNILETALGILESQQSLYLVGQNFKELLPSRTSDTTENLISDIKLNPITDSTILIKGSRSNGLEKLIEYL